MKTTKWMPKQGETVWYSGSQYILKDMNMGGKCTLELKEWNRTSSEKNIKKGIDFSEIDIFIQTSHNGVPTQPEHQQMIHDKIRSVPCKCCKAEAGEDCKNTKGVHMGRLPDGWDSYMFIRATLKGEEYTPKSF